jgi:hypothetical protein
MKKLFLFIGVIMSCLLFSCKKDSTPPPPPLKIDSLAIPFSIGTWWKYQRFDSSVGQSPSQFDSSIELITVIGKGKLPYLTYWGTPESIILEVKNLTSGTVETNYASYFDTSFNILDSNGNLNLALKVPQMETQIPMGNYVPWSYFDINYYSVYNNITVPVFNKIFNGCTFTEVEGYRFTTSVQYFDYHSIIYLKPEIGFVYWSTQSEHIRVNPGLNHHWYVRKIIDYHIAQ